MRNFYLGLLALSLSLSSQAQQLVSASVLDTTSRFFINFFAAGQARFDVVNYKITYNTLDADGVTPTVASGALSVPISNCDSLALVCYAHGTVLRRDDVPSRNNLESTIGKVYASVGYVAVMPDYLGLGDNPGIHPYLHAESQATASIDLMRAAREFIRDSLPQIQLNGEVLLTGYSQGGHAAMGTAKYLQDNMLLGEFQVKGVAPASGPYNLAGSQAQVFIDDLPYSNPGYVVYLLLGMNRAYGNIFNSVDEILKAPYDTLIPPFFDGTWDMDTVNQLLPAQISGYLEDSVLQSFIADTLGQQHPIWQALNRNTNYDWRPNMPLRMYYCTNDEQVGFQNSLDALQAMRAQGAPSVAAINRGNLDHGGCVSPSISASVGFFDSVAVSCAAFTGLEHYVSQPAWRLYPNPSQGWIRIDSDGPQRDIELVLFNRQAQVVHQQKSRSGERLRLADLPAGLYFYHINSGQQQQSGKLYLTGH